MHIGYGDIFKGYITCIINAVSIGNQVTRCDIASGRGEFRKTSFGSRRSHCDLLSGLGRGEIPTRWRRRYRRRIINRAGLEIVLRDDISRREALALRWRQRYSHWRNR